MGRKSIADGLTSEINQVVIQTIIEGRNSDSKLLEWLKSKGINSFSSASFSRYCVDIRRQLKSIGVIKITPYLSSAAIARHFDKLNELAGLYAQHNEIKGRIEVLETFLDAEFLNGEDEED